MRELLLQQVYALEDRVEEREPGSMPDIDNGWTFLVTLLCGFWWLNSMDYRGVWNCVEGNFITRCAELYYIFYDLGSDLTLSQSMWYVGTIPINPRWCQTTLTRNVNKILQSEINHRINMTFSMYFNWFLGWNQSWVETIHINAIWDNDM